MQSRTTVFINHPDSPIYEVTSWLNTEFRDKSHQEAMHFVEKIKKQFPEFRRHINLKNIREKHHRNILPAMNHLRVIK